MAVALFYLFPGCAVLEGNGRHTSVQHPPASLHEMERAEARAQNRYSADVAVPPGSRCVYRVPFCCSRTGFAFSFSSPAHHTRLGYASSSGNRPIPPLCSGSLSALHIPPCAAVFFRPNSLHSPVCDASFSGHTSALDFAKKDSGRSVLACYVRRGSGASLVFQGN